MNRATFARAATLLAAAAGATAQECIWTPLPYSPGINNAGPLVYHAGLQRVMLVESAYPYGVRLWTWEGDHWALVAAPATGTRGGFAVCYDSGRDRLVLFGGQDGNTRLQDTWEWDRAAWARVALAGPPGRSGAGLVYDQARARAVLFGGAAGSSSFFGDTWEWDGATWTQRASGGPPGRWVSCMAYDSGRAKTVLYGGFPLWLHLTDLWEWDGAVWTQRASDTPGLEAQWMIFDPARSKMIVSIYAPNPNEGTWELDTVSALWQIRTPGIARYGDAAFDPARGVGLWSHFGYTSEYRGEATVVPPAILAGPEPVSVLPHATITLSVQAAGNSNTYQWKRDGLDLVDGARISGARTTTLTIRPAMSADTGDYTLAVSSPCGSFESQSAPVRVALPSQECYANCDNSSVPPLLNVLDFACFMRRFASGDPYANCDQASTPPVLNVLDFVCFTARFADGCPNLTNPQPAHPGSLP